MTGENTLTTGPRRGVSGVLRLVVLALTLTGFVAMHGVASAAGGAHCGAPPALVATSDAHGGTYGVTHGLTVDHGMATAMAHLASVGASVGAPVPLPDSDDLMVGCLLALLGALVAIGLRLLGRSGTNATAPGVRRAGAWLRAARAPPNPLFLSLCAFRL